MCRVKLRLEFGRISIVQTPFMPTHLTQFDGENNLRTRLLVKGEMFGVDAMNIERITRLVAADGDREIILDLADLDFLDSDSAPILKRLEREGLFGIEGIEIFLQHAINDAERD